MLGQGRLGPISQRISKGIEGNRKMAVKKIETTFLKGVSQLEHPEQLLQHLEPLTLDEQRSILNKAFPPKKKSAFMPTTIKNPEKKKMMTLADVAEREKEVFLGPINMTKKLSEDLVKLNRESWNSNFYSHLAKSDTVNLFYSMLGDMLSFLCSPLNGPVTLDKLVEILQTLDEVSSTHQNSLDALVFQLLVEVEAIRTRIHTELGQSLDQKMDGILLSLILRLKIRFDLTQVFWV
jgi:hypothetical protein